MKQLLISFVIITSFYTAKCQLTTGTWLVGGVGKFYSYNSEISSQNNYTEGDFTQIDLSPNIGYFVADKLAFGLKPTFSSIKGKITTTGGGSTNVQRYWIGPFGRYYFLETERQFNLLAELSYQFGLLNAGGQKGDLRTFTALTGPVIYFNSTVGIEFLLGYSYSKEDVESAIKIIHKGFQIAVGLQVHLEKDNSPY